MRRPFAHIALALLVAALTASPGVSAWPPTTRPADASKNHAEKKKKPPRRPRGLAVKALRMSVPNARFDEMAFEDFAEWLGRTTEANVVVRWKTLEKAGVERDAKITLRLKDVRVRKLLSLVFDEVTKDLDDVELAAQADDNTLTISTKADLDKALFTRVYDVQDLLIVVPDFAGRSINDPSLGRNRPLGLGSGGGSEVNKPDERVQDLINLITSAIEPKSWRINGGKGTIVFFKGQLVVRNNRTVHDLLGGDKKPAKKSPPKAKPPGKK